MHGHSFRVDVIVEGELDPSVGYLIDFADIKRATEPLERELDHRCLNEIAGLENPTSEMVAAWIWAKLKPALPMLSEIVVHETCTSTCHFRG
jgi:6-pyruvoyltetrahydropterin/6-carboxytetrahydropterin synthase